MSAPHLRFDNRVGTKAYFGTNVNMPLEAIRPHERMKSVVRLTT
jgi:hypothetical protein